MLNTLEKTFNWVCIDFEAELIEFEGERDHVHLLVNYPPKVSISRLVNSLKGVSSRILRRDFANEIVPFLWKGVLWSPSYFAGSCGGAPLHIIKQYILQQNSPRFLGSNKECLTSPT
jgi:putative transposase